MRIFIDMDEVMADAEQRFLDWYERDFGVKYSKADIHGTKLYAIVPTEHRQIVKGYPHQKDFFKDLAIMPYSQEMIKELNDRFDVYVASAAMEFEHSLQVKYEWLNNHFPFIHWKRRILCGDKSVLKGDVLIDDHDFNLSVFNGRAIMFTASHNVNDTRYERMNSWLDAEKLFDLK